MAKQFLQLDYDVIPYDPTVPRVETHDCAVDSTPRLSHAKSDRKMTPDAQNAPQALPQHMDGRQSQRTALARRIRLLLQLSAAESSTR